MNTASPRILPPALTQLVRHSVAALGSVIKRELGAASFQGIEKLRREMTVLRNLRQEEQYLRLKRLILEFRRVPAESRRDIAHAFTLMLELMNACENAYRTNRLKNRGQNKAQGRGALGNTPKAIVYVLTAHPSEARSPANIAVFQAIHALLVKILGSHFETHREELHYLLALAWRTSTAPSTRPSVEDEAAHLYSILLRPSNLETLLECTQEISPVHIRTWVGGDKDGHPFVNERTLQNSLQLSRDHLLSYANFCLAEVTASDDRVFRRTCLDLQKKLQLLRRVGPGDGARVERVRQALSALARAQRARMGAAHPQVSRMEKILALFPALVVPLELRESADLIHAASRRPLTIYRMLKRLSALSEGGDPRWYARGLIISMTSSAADVRAGIRLAKIALGSDLFPVIPLFEQLESLEAAPVIVKELLSDPQVRRIVKKSWANHFELMLGYSDSAKEVGALKSRILIARALRQTDSLLRKNGCVPVFFHGAGGSVDRGGGSIDEQTAWWPRSALDVFKATIQGEMVERTFASPEITRGQLERIAKRARERTRTRDKKLSPPENHALREFIERTSLAYRSKLTDPFFPEIIRKATLYGYLDALRIGSRPVSRRSGSPQNTDASTLVRAIPWVLCWTQSRALFPAWWGTGTAWRKATAKEKSSLRRAFDKDPLLRSYVKILGFTLAKVELPVWRIYLENFGLPEDLVKATFAEFEREFQDSCRFVRALSQERSLLWFRPWLASSIRLRSPMIHPLNLLQILAMHERDDALLRITVTGIASGMMTTG